MNKRTLIGIGIIVICGGVAFSALRGSLTPYVGFAEARELDRNCQVYGSIDKKHVHFDPVGGTLNFRIIDEDGEVLPVAFQGEIPGNFDQAMSVACQGKYDNGTFYANKLLVKCPSKYQGLEAAGEENPHAEETILDDV